ncbi:MAG: tyrosine-type recombinase/integrase [Gemmataceae bacterium]
MAAIKQVLKFVRRLYATTSANEFSPKKLKAVREAMIAEPVVYRFKEFDPKTDALIWRTKIAHQHPARRTVNKQIGRLKRLYAWAVAEELVHVSVHDALLRVPGLRRDESCAREVARVRPVSTASVNCVLPLLPVAIKAMIQVQLASSARPQDIVNMRVIDIDRSSAVWEFRPLRHKTEHHNPDGNQDLDRVVYLGPKAQEILQPWVDAQPEGYMFSPIVSEQIRNAERRALRTSPLTPSQAARRPRARRQAMLRCQYDVSSYRRAVRRACITAGIAVWCPNQLRHTRLSEIRKGFGLEAARVCGGHREIGVTQIYAEQDCDLARRVMAATG